MHYARRIVTKEADDNPSKTLAQTDEITQVISTLSARIDNLDALMKQKILTSHEELLSQVIRIKVVDSTLGQIEEQVREIKSYMHGLRAKIRIPYEQAVMYTNQLTNLQKTIKYVRSISKFIQLVRRLLIQIPDSSIGDESKVKPDFPLAALTLLDIERLVNGNDLLGIKIVDDALDSIVDKRRALTTKEAERLLDSGMKRQNQSDIASGLQIMFNLGALANTIANKVHQYTLDWAEFVAGKLDPKGIHSIIREHNSKSTNIDGSDMIGITSVVWSTLESIVNELLAKGLELRTLERVLARKRDTLPRFDLSAASLEGRRTSSDLSSTGASAIGTSFLDLVIGKLGDRALAFWWGTAVAALSNEIEEACKNSNVIRQTLTNSYPRLVQLFIPKLEHILSPKLGGVTSILTTNTSSWPITGGSNGMVSIPMTPRTPRTPAVHTPLSFKTQPSTYLSYDDPGCSVLWNKLLGKFESEYISRASTRMDDAVKRCYPPPPPPGLLNAQETWKRGAKNRQRSDSNTNATELELMTAVSVVPNRKLVAGVIRSISTELEMAKSDAKLHHAICKEAKDAVSTFVDITKSKLDSITVNPSVLDPLALPAHPLTKSFVGLVNSVEYLRKGLLELFKDMFGVSAVTSNASSRTRSISESFNGAMDISTILDRCLQELSTFVATQTNRLFGAADLVIIQSIVDTGLIQDTAAEAAEAATTAEAADSKFAKLESASQWLQRQVLENLEIDCQKQILDIVDTYLSVYTRSLCLTFPLTEEAKLRLTGEVTQFEFACNQLVAGNSAKGGVKSKLSDVGDSYQALRLMRPLLFVDIKELTDIVRNKQDGADTWQHLPLCDLLNYVVCRIATEHAADSRDVKDLYKLLPFSLLGWTKSQWVELLSSIENNDQGYTLPKTPANIKSRLLGTEDLNRQIRNAAFVESLDKISAHIATLTDDMTGLVQSAKGAVSL
ncbi:hypothetical protein GGI12_002014 [Dipsacomyces acuminosporus]|nr:hypothetical protein GGI12_002014 [Dipsacomyces acuminosporus]